MPDETDDSSKQQLLAGQEVPGETREEIREHMKGH